MGKNFLMGIGNALLAGARRGLIPRGFAFFLAGLAASLLVGFKPNDPPMPICYSPPPPIQPEVIKFSVMPNPTKGAKKIFVSAVLVNIGGRVITGGKFFFMANPSGESDTFALELLPADGSFDSYSENVYCLFDLPELIPGSYPFAIIGYSGPEGGKPQEGRLEVTEK